MYTIVNMIDEKPITSAQDLLQAILALGYVYIPEILVKWAFHSFSTDAMHDADPDATYAIDVVGLAKTLIFNTLEGSISEEELEELFRLDDKKRINELLEVEEQFGAMYIDEEWL